MQCPKCSHKLDAHKSLNGEDVGPVDDDITLCIYCLAVLKYISGSFQLVSEEEFNELPTSMQKDLNFAKLIAEEHRNRFNN